MNLRLLLFSAAALAAPVLAFANPALTIYNQDFAVVRDTVPLDLKAGENDVTFADTTAQLEPDSVILRDPAQKVNFTILEQDYRNDPVSQELLLHVFEGRTIGFYVKEPNKPDHTVQGKIIRSGYREDAQQPVIEVDGKITFGLPGQPVFPSLGDDTILKPALTWKIDSAQPAKLDAELAYVTGGMKWNADYNLVAPENGDSFDFVGWITMNNDSGKTFENATVKLMAGNVNRIEPPMRQIFAMSMAARQAPAGAPAVTEKAFDEYHLYTVQRPVTLHDRETKQVEFTHASNVRAKRIYVYDGASFEGGIWNSGGGGFIANSEYGTEANKKVAVLIEIKNSSENGLGIPLPAGRVRFYRQGDDRQLEFTGEDTIDHTPKDETLRFHTGDAFDIVGDRKRTNFHVDSANRTADESFEIKVRNHKTTPVDVRVVEHLYRFINWEITQKSDPFTKSNAQEIKFTVTLKPDEEKVITYTVHYSW
ncbi:MAG TPA: DUF4139 domain-containing protein [Chthoniobacteraceae bacterium]|nr:DUF4139 domain-containing protein [Chthoniobacteraceae bacterium]